MQITEKFTIDKKFEAKISLPMIEDYGWFPHRPRLENTVINEYRVVLKSNEKTFDIESYDLFLNHKPGDEVYVTYEEKQSFFKRKYLEVTNIDGKNTYIKISPRKN
ncbi:hypothetical protein JXM83_01785 [Candidatus Woesearchaeota archaeon]|nr:hypothetical protein [Candidatus Woesearchaeota archaeon]